jgi:hypothetical protein
MWGVAYCIKEMVYSCWSKVALKMWQTNPQLKNGIMHQHLQGRAATKHCVESVWALESPWTWWLRVKSLSQPGTKVWMSSSQPVTILTDYLSRICDSLQCDVCILVCFVNSSFVSAIVNITSSLAWKTANQNMTHLDDLFRGRGGGVVV